MHFKTFFAAEYHDLKEQQKLNTSQVNFHGVNAAIDLSTALNNLAMAATMDRDIVEHLTRSNQQLTDTNKLLADQLKAALEVNNILMHKLGNTKPTTTTLTVAPPGGTTTKGKGRKVAFDIEEWKHNLDPDGYCWSHGYRVVKGNDSSNCAGKLLGHQDGATRANTMGGSTKGMTFRGDHIG
jgi:hypothetical protein